MDDTDTFDLQNFMPYLLNQAADASSKEFETTYRTKYGMLRTEWRVLFHLGRYGVMTAKDICEHARMHKTKISRAVHALEKKRFLCRETKETDRRHEALFLTKSGQRVYADLLEQARQFDARLLAPFNQEERAQMRMFLKKIAKR